MTRFAAWWRRHIVTEDPDGESSEWEDDDLPTADEALRMGWWV